MPATIARGADGYFHPSTEAELQALVVDAYTRVIPLRVRGSAHSVATAIYTTGFNGEGPPPANVIEVMLDKYRAVVIHPDAHDPTHATVEVEAGCNLGKNPYDPTGTSTWENSLDYQLQKAGFALEDTGGISHQTVSGFMSTGSSGGSLTHSFEDNLVGIRLIDGTGKIWDLTHDDPDPARRDMFCAAGVSLGLLGVISRVRLRVGPTFNIFGSQSTRPFGSAGIDFVGVNDGSPTIEQFLLQAPYTRLMWWPQAGLNRIQVWQASRMKPTPQFAPKPYEEIGRYAQIESLAGSLLSTLMGNLGDLAAVPAKLTNWYQHLDATLGGQPDPNACVLPKLQAARGKRDVGEVAAKIGKAIGDAIAKNPAVLQAGTPPAQAVAELMALPSLQRANLAVGNGRPEWLAEAITWLIAALLNNVLKSEDAQKLGDILAGLMPYIAGLVVSAFVEDGTQWFWESWRCGLPMDNQMDDQLWPTDFTELWIPFEHTTEVMKRLNDFYAANGDPATSYERTGFFSCELYSATASKFWMSPSYGTDVFRVDWLWFALNAELPPTYYQQFWDLLRDLAYRPHWGKYLPAPEYYLGNLPKREAFLKLRETLDPKGIFLTDYWVKQLAITRSP